MNRRRASMLIEIIICMAIGSSLTLLAIGVVHQAMTMSSRTSAQSEIGRAGARLAQQLRADVHRASSVVIEDDQQRLHIASADDWQVVYQITGRRITRERSNAAAQTQEEVEHEAYDFGEGSQMSFNEHDEPQRVELVVKRAVGLHDVAQRLELQVAVVVGKLVEAQRSVGDEP